MRFDPFRELDRLTQEAFGAGRAPAMPMDAWRRGDHFVVSFDLPGVDPDTIDLTVEENVLTVRAERSWRREEGDEVIAAERVHGGVARQLFLGENLDPDRIEARYEHGVLTVTIPVAEKAKPRKVAVTTGGGADAQAIPATSTEAA